MTEGKAASSPNSADEIGLLVSRVAEGEDAAFRDLWEQLSAQISALGQRFLGTREDGQELAQDVFLKIHRAAALFDPKKGNGKAWVFTIARNLAKDKLRQQRLRWVVGLDALPVVADDTAPGTEQRVSDRSDLIHTSSRILELPDAQRMALLLVAIAEMQTPEIAAIMGKSRGSVEQLIVRARRNLRDLTQDRKDDR